MAIDRAAALRNAEKLLRQGKLDPAIEEYARIVDDQPTDWNTRNTLGDLLVRAGQIERAVTEFTRIADAFKQDGFYSKAAALYRKILKIKPHDEHATLQGAEIAVTQGLLADARQGYSKVAAARRERGDREGELAVVIRIAALDPDDVDARVRGALAQATLGDVAGARQALRVLADDLREQQRHEPLFVVLQHARTLDSDNVDLAIEALEARLVIHPREIETLSQLIDLAVDTGRADLLTSAQDRLVDAHLAAGATREARFVAEDMLTRAPDVPAHVARLRRVLEASGETDIDGQISALLNEPSSDGVSEVPSAADAAQESIPVDVAVEAQGSAQPDSPLEVHAPAGPVPPMAEAVGPAMPPPSPPRPVAPSVAPTEQAPIAPAAPEPSRAGEDRVPGTRVAQAQHRSPNIEVDLSVVLDQLPKPHTPAAPAPSPQDAAPDLDDVFAQMRDEAKRRQALQNAEQEYRRGVGLFQSGQVEASIKALESAASAPRFRFEAASLLGRIFLNRGDLPRAIEWLDRASEATAPSPAEAHRILYDLADALESTGDSTRALSVMLELQASAGVFRDVPERIKRLMTAQPRG